jgi:hypothetical protein
MGEFYLAVCWQTASDRNIRASVIRCADPSRRDRCSGAREVPAILVVPLAGHHRYSLDDASARESRGRTPCTRAREWLLDVTREMAESSASALYARSLNFARSLVKLRPFDAIRRR